MLKFECECKSESRDFFVNKKSGMIQCIDCRQRFVFRNGAWEKFNVKKEFKRAIGKLIDKAIDKAVKPMKEVQESMGVWMKKHGIVKEKKEKIKEIPQNYFAAPLKRIKDLNLQEKHIKKKWAMVIWGLEHEHLVTITKNAYNGKLRGRDAARACHTDLKVIGINTRLRFTKDRSATLELLE